MRDFLAVPFGWVLSAFYGLTDNYILSILLLTVLVRLFLLPASISQQKNSAKQVRLNAKVNKIRQKYAGNQQKIQEETQALYQREGFGAANMGCSNLIIQLLVMTGLYGVIYTPITSVIEFSKDTVSQLKKVLGPAITEFAGKNAKGKEEMIILNVFEKNEDKLTGILDAAQLDELRALKADFNILGVDLTDTPEVKDPSILWIIPILACLTALASSLFMFFRQKKQNPEMAKNPTMGCMTFMSPVMSLMFTFAFPAGVGV
jgi:YidC/Oxa1 family membrane protein insertase